MTYVLALIVTLGVLVTVHELGHYWIARMSGVRILRFAVGFGKPIWSRKDQRGTEWAVAAIPLGGYVRMLDERDGDAEVLSAPGDISYNMLHPRWRIAIALGGPFANFALAIFVYWLLALAGTTSYAPVIGGVDTQTAAGQAGMRNGLEITQVDGSAVRSWQEVNMALAARLGDTGSIELSAREAGGNAFERAYQLPISSWHSGEDEPDLIRSLGLEPTLAAVIGSVVEGSAASRAGFAAGDRFVSVGGVAIDGWNAFQEEIVRYPGEEVEITVARGAATVALIARPDARDVGEGQQGFLGVGPLINEIRYGAIEAIGVGFAKTGDTVALTLNLLKKMVFGQVSLSNLSGPITIAKVAGDSAAIGWKYFLGVLALLSVSLGVLNLLPIPVLDGGHVVFAAAEWVRGRPVPDRAVEVGYQVGIFLVAGLMVLAIYNDVARLVSG